MDEENKTQIKPPFLSEGETCSKIRIKLEPFYGDSLVNIYALNEIKKNIAGRMTLKKIEEKMIENWQGLMKDFECKSVQQRKI